MENPQEAHGGNQSNRSFHFCRHTCSMNHFKAFKDAEFVPSSTPVETDQFPPQVSFPESKGFIVFQHYTRHFLKKTNQSTFLISSFSLTHLDASASVLQVPSG